MPVLNSQFHLTCELDVSTNRSRMQYSGADAVLLVVSALARLFIGKLACFYAVRVLCEKQAGRRH